MFQGGAVRVKGPMLELPPLPTSLVVALLDDKARVDTATTATKASSSLLVTVNEACDSSMLSVSDVLTRTLQRAKIKGIPDCEGTVLRLRQLFECLFEASILYTAERKDAEVKQQLAHFRSQRVTYAESCGAVYLLRLLVLVTTGADTLQYGDGSDHSGGVSSRTQAASSKERRNAVKENKHKNEFYRLQEVIDVCVKELDDVAHTAF